MKNKILKFIKLPIYEKFNIINHIYWRLKTQFFYKFFFKYIGKKTTITEPMFLKNIHRISLGKNVFIRSFARLEVVDYGEIIIEDNVSIEQSFTITATGKLVIGKNTIISFNVMITDVDHDYQEVDKHILKQKYIKKITKIGENCFIGSGAKIQAGTVLGKQCIVGTNAVVRGKFPDYCVIVGTPAKIIKRYDTSNKQWRRTDKEGNFIDEV